MNSRPSGSYDHEDQLTGVETDTSYTPVASRWKVVFTYDGRGRLRVKKDYAWYETIESSEQVQAIAPESLVPGQWQLSGEIRYLYDGMLVVQERTASNTPTVTYARGRDLSGGLDGVGGIGGLLVRSHGYSAGSWSYHNYYHADGNGNVTALVNASGTLQASYKYDPYGRYLGGSGGLAAANVMRFSSKPWVAFAGSTTAGLYSYGYRFYDPYLQRWVNRDPIEESGGINVYSFVGNRPLDGIDVLGLDLHPVQAPWGDYYDDDSTFPYYYGDSLIEDVSVFPHNVGAGVVNTLGAMGAAAARFADEVLGPGGAEFAALYAPPITRLGCGAATVGRDCRGAVRCGAKSANLADNAADATRLRNQLASQEIAGGYAFGKHVVKEGQFPGITMPQEFSAHIESIMNNPSAVRHLSKGRTAYWDCASGTVVIRNPGAIDGGTAFKPRQGKAFFENLK